MQLLWHHLTYIVQFAFLLAGSVFIVCERYQSPAFAADTAGVTGLGTLGGSSSTAYGISDDGSVVVGSSILGSGLSHAFLWSLSDNTMHDLGTLGGSRSEAFAVSRDGSVVVGTAAPAGDASTRAVRWTLSDNTIHDLGNIGGGTRSYAKGVSDDGSVIVGHSFLAGDRYFIAFRWTLSDNTMHELVPLAV